MDDWFLSGRIMIELWLFYVKMDLENHKCRAVQCVWYDMIFIMLSCHNTPKITILVRILKLIRVPNFVESDKIEVTLGFCLFVTKHTGTLK